MGLIIVDGKARTYEQQLEHLTKAHQIQKEVNTQFTENITELNEKISEGPTPEQLLAKLQPEYGISADLSEDGKKVELHLDQSQYKEKVIINKPPTATAGTFTQEQLNKLLPPTNAFISFNGEEYYLSDDKTSSGSLIFTHVSGDTSDTFFVKSITITISTLGWVLTKKEIGSGGDGGLTRHQIHFEVEDAYLSQAYFEILLKKESRFENISELQNFLVSNGYTNTGLGVVGGFYMSMTDSFVKSIGAPATADVGAPLYLYTNNDTFLASETVFANIVRSFTDTIKNV